MQRLILLFVAVLLLVGGAVFWIDRSSSDGYSVLDSGDGRPRVLDVDSGVLAAPAGSEDSLTAGSRGAADRTSAGRTAALTGEWIEGTIALPVGAPTEDLGVWVLARDARLDAGEWDEVIMEQPADLVRVPVEDGRFRFQLREEGTSRLWLDSQWLYLDRAPRVGADDEPLLEPKLGASLEVTALRPAGAADDEQLAGIEVELVGMSRERGGMWGGRTNERKARLDAQGRARFDGLSAENSWLLRSSPERWATYSELGIELEPAQTGTADMAFKVGGRVFGRALDDRGAPIEGAEVSWRSANRFASMGERRDPALTDRNGVYRLYGVRPGKGSVRVTANGYLEVQSVELEPRDGELLSGIDLVLGQGLWIAGQVRSEDGAPAADALVSAERIAESSGRRRGWGRLDAGPALEARSDEDGKFRITGLVEGEYRVSAEWKAGDAKLWRAAAPEVAADTLGLELVVTPPQGLTVRVEGPGGVPVPNANVSARPADPGDLDVINLDLYGNLKTDEEGRCFVENVWSGMWRIRVRADGLIQEVDPLEVFAGGEEVLVTMVPASSIAGVVFDPDGKPLKDATVSLRDPSTVSSTPWGMSFGGDSETAATDEDGRFRLESLAPGSYELFATHKSWAASEPDGLELRIGDELQGLVLELRRGGTVRGVIYDAEGHPDSGRSIMAYTQGGASGRPATTSSDANGEFTLERLEPGAYQVMAQPDMRKVQEEMEGSDNPSPASFMKMMEMTSATVVDSEVTEVVLGAPPEAPVRIHGRVTKSGEPVSGGMVTVMREGGSVLDNFEPADVKKDGSYELIIDGAGRATVVYTRAGFGRSGSEFPVVIPERSDFRLDLALPGGEIAGQVLGKDGGPLKELMVTLERKTGLPTVTGMGMGNMERTDAEGRFLFQDLEAGVYDLRAGGASFFGGSGEFAATVIPDIEVEDGAPTPELRIRLGESGEVAGRVLGPDGQPQAGVALFVRDATGSLLARVSSVSTDANGRFVYKGLPAGEVFVEARGSNAAADPVRVTVREDDRTEVDLTLTDSTMLVVRAEDADGNPTRMRLSVTDEAGREVSGLRAMTSFQERMTRGLDTTERRVGPLPPGKYRVLGTDDQGREKSRSVTLKGQKERILRLRFSAD